MAERYFTPSEANDLLPEVRPLAQSLVEHRRGMRLAAEWRARLTARIAGNGGDLDPQEPSGLVDFPALHEGEEVLLCWQLGEDEVAHWHRVDEGFAGRKPLPLD